MQRIVSAMESPTRILVASIRSVEALSTLASSGLNTFTIRRANCLSPPPLLLRSHYPTPIPLRSRYALPTIAMLESWRPLLVAARPSLVRSSTSHSRMRPPPSLRRRRPAGYVERAHHVTMSSSSDQPVCSQLCVDNVGAEAWSQVDSAR